MLRFSLTVLILISLKFNYFVYSALPALLVLSMTHAECIHHNATLTKKLNCSLDTNQLYSLLNFGISFKRKVTQSNFSFKLFYELNKQKVQFLGGEMDFCASLTSLHTNYLVAFALKEVVHKSNLPLGCPFKEGKEYYVKKYNSADVYLPPYVPRTKWYAEMILFCENEKTFTLKTAGKIVKVYGRKRY